MKNSKMQEPDEDSPQENCHSPEIMNHDELQSPRVSDKKASNLFDGFSYRGGMSDANNSFVMQANGSVLGGVDRSLVSSNIFLNAHTASKKGTGLNHF